MNTREANRQDPRGWPEAVAITALLAVIGLLASGWVDPMLPWTH